MFNAFEFLWRAVLNNVSVSLALIFFQALGMEIQRYRNVCCALID
jgi:hypothetical protein